MYFFKRILRWYNPSKILAKNISEKLWIWLENNIFKKIKYTKSQKFLSRQDRWTNLDNSLEINKKQLDKIVDKNIIIVDDIISTWATLNQMAKILKKNKAKKIIALVVASD
jgi:competence protein ComFC